MENNEAFKFTYNAGENEEIENIKKKYLPEKQDKLELLRRLDRSVEVPGTVVSLVLGIIGLLIFGLGMSCALVWHKYYIAVALGVVGAVVLAFAYPAYKKITQKRKEELAPQILSIIEELEKGF